MKSNLEEPLDQLRKAMESSLELPAEWVFVMRGAPVGRKAERKRHARDLGTVIVIRDKSQSVAATPTVAAGVSVAAIVQVEGGNVIGSKSTTLCFITDWTHPMAKLFFPTAPGNFLQR